MTVIEEECRDNSGTVFALMFLETQPNQASDLDLYVTSTSVTSSTFVSLSTPANPTLDIGSSSYIIAPLSSIKITLPAASLKDTGSKRGTRGFRLATNQEVTVHGVTSQAVGACGGFMAIPMGRLGYEYVVVSYWSQADGFTVTEMGIVATEANTEVVIELNQNGRDVVNVLFEGVVYGSDGNNLIRVSLGAFETVQLQAVNDLTGSRIYASKRVAAFSGNIRTAVEQSNADHIIEQLLPVGAFGSLYSLVPMPNRAAGERYHIIAVEPNTTIFSSNAGTPMGFLVNAGDVYASNLFDALQIRADKEIIVAQYSVSSQVADSPSILGEPAMVILPSEDNYKNVHYFSVPASESAEYNPQLIVVAPGEGLTDIYIDGVQITLRQWHEIGDIGTNRYWAVLGTSSGFHRVYCTDSNVRFSVVLYGFVETQCAYSYPTGMCLDYDLVVSLCYQVLGYWECLIMLFRYMNLKHTLYRLMINENFFIKMNHSLN